MVIAFFWRMVAWLLGRLLKVRPLFLVLALTYLVGCFLGYLFAGGQLW
jgi:hypothetical protein